MPAVHVRPYSSSDLPALGRLLAARHLRDSARLPAQAPELTNAEMCAQVLGAEYVTGRLKETAVAESGGEIVGFLAGERMLLPPANFASQYVEPHSISMHALGHAVSADVDATTVYRALYTFLAEGWVRDGYFVHSINVIAGDLDVQEAWLSLGFGRKMTAAVRDVGPVAVVHARPEIRAASSEDIDLVMKLVDSIAVHEAASPMFTPFAREVQAGLRAHQLELLNDPANPHFIAFEGPEALGIQTFAAPGFTPQTVTQEKTIYLYEGAVLPSGRGQGIGGAILDHAMAWARESGYERCCLHFNSGNWSGAPFWLGQGFVPVEHQMIRRVDPRIAWAKG